MTRLIGLATLMMTALVTTVPISLAQTNSNPEGDSRIRAALEELGFKYEVDRDGDFKVSMRLENGRTQTAWIISQTHSYGDLEIREIVSPAYLSERPLSADVANKLLEDSSIRKLGAWQIWNQNNRSLAVFSAKIPANVNAKELGDSLIIVMGSADEMEQELTGKNDF